MVGAGIAIFIQSNLVHQLRYKPHNRCSKNQAEQLPIVKALETIEKSHFSDNILRKLIHRQQNHPSMSQEPKNHNYLIQEIRKKAIALEKSIWTIIFTSIKAHAGNYGNELADKLAKETADTKI